MLLAAALGSSTAATAAQNAGGDATTVERGRITFRMHCSPCHGMDARGGRAPDLTTGIYANGSTDADLSRVISSGVPGTEMSGFGDNLDVEGVRQVISYLRSVTDRPSAPPSGEARAGETLYWGKAGCHTCHRIGSRGGKLGPDLTRIGRQRSLAHLRESIVSPNADLTRGYAAVTVVTRDGRSIVGVQRNIDNFSAQLMDAGENFHSFLRSEVTSIRREFRSLMPADYARRMTPRDIDDLVAYLSAQRLLETKP
jgi:putative heme-binding domain-containing protein